MNTHEVVRVLAFAALLVAMWTDAHSLATPILITLLVIWSEVINVKSEFQMKIVKQMSDNMIEQAKSLLGFIESIDDAAKKAREKKEESK